MKLGLEFGDKLDNSDQDYAAEVLSKQYSSVFTQPRPEFLVEDLSTFFSGGREWSKVHQGRPTLHDIRFTKQNIERACREWKASESLNQMEFQLYY